MIAHLTASLALVIALGAPLRAQTEVYLKVGGQGSGANLIKLALPEFTGDSAGMQDIVRGDLLFSRYFAVLVDQDYKAKGAAWLLSAHVSNINNKIIVGAKLTDLNSKELVFDRQYRQDLAYRRSIAHKLSDDVVKAVTGKAGIANSQIAFANDQSGHKELYLVDYDGANLKPLTKNRSITILPRFAPGRKRLAYTSYKDGNPDLFIFDLEQGKSRPVSTQQGLNIAGGFSHDGNQLLMTLSRQKSPNLYVKDLNSGSVTQLTQHFGADSSPTFSPDSSQVAFVSDRAGNPQIYVLDMATHRAKRLTNLNWCDSPSWSPTGEWIAFAGRVNNKDKMDIYIVDVTGNQIRQLTKGKGSNENPSWSPDGRFLAFASNRNGKKPSLYVMDADGSAPHKVADIPGGSYTPNWSN